MKKILHVMSGTGLGGPKSVFLAHQKLLQNLGYEVLPVLRPGALLHSYLKGSKPLELGYYRISLPGLRSIMISRIKALTDQVKPDLIWVHKPIDAFLFRRACPHIKIVLIVHGFQHKNLENATVLVAVSPLVLAYLKAKGRTNVFLMNNFIDFEVSRHTINWHRPIRIGALGFYRRKKGFTDFIKAIALLEQTSDGFEAHLCGGGTLKVLIELMAKYYRLGRLKIHPWQHDADKWMKSMDIIVVPSRQESFGMVVIEAMARGALVIATRSGGPEALVADGETGILVSPRDPQALCDAIMRVLQDPDKWTQVRAQGRKFVAKHYTLQAARKSILSILQACGLSS